MGWLGVRLMTDRSLPPLVTAASSFGTSVLAMVFQWLAGRSILLKCIPWIGPTCKRASFCAFFASLTAVHLVLIGPRRSASADATLKLVSAHRASLSVSLLTITCFPCLGMGHTYIAKTARFPADCFCSPICSGLPNATHPCRPSSAPAVVPILLASILASLSWQLHLMSTALSYCMICARLRSLFSGSKPMTPKRCLSTGTNTSP